MKPRRLAFQSIDPDINRYRHYSLELFPHDLFGRYELIRTFGRIGQEGRTLVRVYETREEAEKAAQRLIKIRLRHGYRQIEADLEGD